MNLKKYPEARANFLKCTDRNEVFPGFLKRIFKYSSFQSLLDINAGDDSSAMFLSKMVTKYVPVDSIAEASCFRNGTFNVVIVQSLPTAIESRMLLTEEVARSAHRERFGSTLGRIQTRNAAGISWSELWDCGRGTCSNPYRIKQYGGSAESIGFCLQRQG